MILDAVRINYDQFILSCDPLIAGTIVVFDDQLVKYSYLIKGRMEALDSSTVTGIMWYAPCFEDWKVRQVDTNIKRYIAVHEDSEMICIFSKHDIELKLADVKDTYTLEPHTAAIVVNGEFTVEGKIAKRFVKIKPRDYPIELFGNGSLIIQMGK